MSNSKVALVIDCISNIGQAIVKSLAKKGYLVAIVGNHEELVCKIAQECAELSPVKFKPPTFTQSSQDSLAAENFVKSVVEHFGRLDVLVNNTDCFRPTSAHNINSFDDYRLTISNNCDVAVKASLTAIDHLKKTKGNIIFISSVASTKPYPESYAYGMSKAAISLLAKSLAIDLAPHVRVNTISPNQILGSQCKSSGLTGDNIEQVMSASTLIHQTSHHDDVANAVLFLISDEAAFINGHEMFVDGGHLITPSNYNVSSVIRAQMKRS